MNANEPLSPEQVHIENMNAQNSLKPQEDLSYANANRTVIKITAENENTSSNSRNQESMTMMGSFVVNGAQISSSSLGNKQPLKQTPSAPIHQMNGPSGLPFSYSSSNPKSTPEDINPLPRNINNNSTQSSLTSVTNTNGPQSGPIARIYSNGSAVMNSINTAPAHLNAPNAQMTLSTTNNANNNNTSMSSNLSVTSSYTSTNSSPVAASAASLLNPNTNTNSIATVLTQSHSTHQGNPTLVNAQMSASFHSAATSNLNNNNPPIALNELNTNNRLQQQQRPISSRPGVVNTSQPTFANGLHSNNNAAASANEKYKGNSDDVIYKFKSSKVIGGKTSNDDEFGDLDSDTSSSKLSKCYSCFKCFSCFKCC